jgi:hypothetical protein
VMWTGIRIKFFISLLLIVKLRKMQESREIVRVVEARATLHPYLSTWSTFSQVIEMLIRDVIILRLGKRRR